MLTGKELGEAIRSAMRKKGMTPSELAKAFDIKPPSVSGWFTTGRISKANFERLRVMFSDVVGPEHWGLTNPQINHVAESGTTYTIAKADNEAESIVLRAFRLAPDNVRRLWIHQAEGILNDLDNPSQLAERKKPRPGRA